MASLELQPAADSKTKRKIHPSLHIDMTPMVDLGFLLITFFIFTATLSEKNFFPLVMPADGPPTPIHQSRSLSFLLSNDDKIYAYEGLWEEAVQNNKVISTTYNATGIRNIIINKQKQLGGTDKLIVVIKPLSQSTYKNTVDVLDEMLINGVTKYAIAEPDVEETNYVSVRDKG